MRQLLKTVPIKRNGTRKLPQFKIHVQFRELRESCDTIQAVDSHALETQMDEVLGWELSQLRLGQGSSKQASVARSHLSYFLDYYPDDEFVARCIRSNFAYHAVPVCMVFENEAELHECATATYQLMYFHYFLGKHQKLKGQFPQFCCGLSARSLTLSLWESGVVAAVSAYDYIDDHAYVIIPYRIRGSEKMGVILADPTSDQLNIKKSERVRNVIALLPPAGWEYRTDWQGGSDLYPQLVQYSSCYGAEDVKYTQYIKRAFSNGACLR